MDYDDNDILHHNPQLAGEGISKSSSVLRPYDFPRFDFDDNLQGHLKFDSLVEPEVFLGIQSQEDNQWIEDFSRGSNGMEFNSAPADSCSIPRRDNVWSEATSSESVEMLLKSVGQEEKMSGQSYIQDSNTCDDQGTVSNHVEFRSNLDGNNDVATGSSEGTLPQEEFVKNHPQSEGELKEQLRYVEVPSAAAASMESTDLASDDLVRNVTFGKGWEATNEGKNSYSGGCSIEKVKEMNSSDVKSTECEAVEDSLCHMKAVDNITSDLVALSDPADNSNNDKEEKHVSSGRGEEDSKILNEMGDEASIHMHSASNSFCLVAESGAVNNNDAGDGNCNNVIKIVDKSVGRNSEIRSSQEEDGNGLSPTSLHTEKHEIKNLASTCEVDDRVEGCKHGSGIDGIHLHSADSGSSNAPHSASSEQTMNSSVQLAYTGNNDQMKGVPASPLKNETISAVPLFHIEDNKVVAGKLDHNDDTNITESSDMLVLNPAVESKQTNDIKGIHTNAEEPTTHVAHVTDSSNLTNEENSEHMRTEFAETKHIHVPCVIDGSNLVNEENSDHMQTDLAESKQDMHLTKERDENLPVEAGNDDAENIIALKDDQRVESNKEVKESSPSPASNDVSECELREPAVAGLSYSEIDPKEHATRIEPDVDLKTETDSVSKFEVSVADDVNKMLPVKTLSVSSESMEKSSEVNSSVSPPIAANRDEESSQSQVDLGNSRSLKDSTGSDLGSEKNHELTKRAEGEKEPPAETSEVDKASCGSPTVIPSCEPSQMGKDNLEQTKDSQIMDKSVNDIQPSSDDKKRDDRMGDDTGFTFKVTALQDTTEGESTKCWSPVPIAGNGNSAVANTPAGQGKKARTSSQKTPRKNARVSHAEDVPGSSKPKGTSERKGRRSSAKGTAKEIAKSSLAKGADLDASSGAGDKPQDTFVRTSSLSSPNVQPCGPIEHNGTKVLSGGATPTSNLPDLNTSTLSNSSCPSPSSRQPFTDSQQVQLRAQIFVYGSLIQGTAPDEACMVSAFGSSDGGRTVWEPVWRSAIERVRSQKSNVNTPETPLHCHSGPKASDVAATQSPHSSKLLPSPVSRSSSKGTPSPAVSPKIPLSPPLWSISTPFRDSLPSTGANKGPVVDYQHAATPMHPYQTPPIRSFVGHSSWPSQTCFPGPWIASPRTSPFNSTVCFQPVTMTETAKLTPQRESSGPLPSSVKHITSSPTVHNVGPSPVFVGISPLPNQNNVSSAEKHSVDAKPRKRKKVPLPDPSQAPVVSEARIEPLVVTNAAHILSSAVVPATAGPSLDAVPGKVAVGTSVVFSHDRSEKSDLKAQKVVSCSEETLAQVAEAKSEAEHAAAVAAAAVKNSNDLWSELARQKDSRLTPESEAKLAAAAVAIAAAASVTKAAAAAAEVAYHAALQAKLMADEAILSSRPSSSDGKCSADPFDARNATPASILKSDKITIQSNSILVAAKEAAKRRIEAASAASKQAENLNAIVKAAELAATAVSQAGQIVAMGEPLPLSELIEAGPDGCWKLTQPPRELDEIPFNWNKQGSTEGTAASAKDTDGSADKGGSKALIRKNSHSRRRPREKLDSHVDLVNGVQGPGQSAVKGFTNEKELGLSDSLKYGARVTESQAAPKTDVVQNEHEDVGVHRHRIKEGSLVEVFKHEDGVQSAWYSANIVKVEDGKVFVCYSDVLSETGSGNLCEWVPLECEGDKAPVIRAAHPSTASQSQGTRKRRRAALGHYGWSVGDRVDVWINYCWREGVVTEKDDKDETTLKVHFPAQGETSTVRASNLRTSRLWTDGKWVEWTSAGRLAASEQSDTPQEKRRKTGSSAIPSKEVEKPAINVDHASAKPEESELPLSTSERVFDMGKTTNDDNGRATRKPLRTRQHTEGSRVIFGVPKPTGKKRKFMDVSKQFPASRTDKTKETNDSVKFAKYLMPQTATTRGWKTPGRNVSQERRTIPTRSRVPSSLKPTRILTQKDNNTRDGNGNTSENRAKHGFSDHEETAEEAPLSSLLTTSKKISSNAKSERLNKGRLASAGEKMSKIEEEAVGDDTDKSVSEASEPRRSNRRIQPTHRLLEGLQSSLIMPKMSFLSHDKGPRSHNKK